MITQRNFLLCLAAFCVFFSLVACEKKDDMTKASTAKAQAKKTEGPKVLTGKVENSSPIAEIPPTKYVYLTESRRDPFQPFLLIKRPVDADPDLAAQTPLQQYDTLQYKLSAIIVGYGQSMAMVIAPNNKSYVVRKGMKIGKSGGTVMQINKEGFIVEEKYRDLTDEVRTNMLEIKLPKREGV